MAEWDDLTGGDSGGAVPARTVVVQPLLGLGDMIQMIPALRAIARSDPSGRIDLITVENFPGRDLFQAEGYVGRCAGAVPRHHNVQTAPPAAASPGAAGEEAIFAHMPAVRRSLIGDNLRRAQGMCRIHRLVRQGAYERAFILADSWRYAAPIRLAGVRTIYGYGSRAQNVFLVPGVLPDGRSVRRRFQKVLEPAARLLEYLGMPLEGMPTLAPPSEARQRAASRHAGRPRPWIGVAVGSAERVRVWPPERTAAILDHLWRAGRRTQFIFATAAEVPLAAAVVAACREARPILQTGLPLTEVMGLLAECDFTFCTDSGLMNLALSLGVPTHALFATVTPYDYWPWLHPIVPVAGLDRQRGVSVIGTEEVVAHFIRAGLLPPESPPSVGEHPLESRDGPEDNAPPRDPVAGISGPASGVMAGI